MNMSMKLIQNKEGEFTEVRVKYFKAGSFVPLCDEKEKQRYMSLLVYQIMTSLKLKEISDVHKCTSVRMGKRYIFYTFKGNLLKGE